MCVFVDFLMKYFGSNDVFDVWNQMLDDVGMSAFDSWFPQRNEKNSLVPRHAQVHDLHLNSRDIAIRQNGGGVPARLGCMDKDFSLCFLRILLHELIVSTQSGFWRKKGKKHIKMKQDSTRWSRICLV